MTSPPFRAAEVRSYYDRHTPAFVRFGQGGGAIHRAVRMPGLTREQAFHYVEDRIVEMVRLKPDTEVRLKADTTSVEVRLKPDTTTEVRVLDLGCGVGASLCYLATRMPMRGVGVTLSPVQVRLAQERIARDGPAGRIEVMEADYTALPAAIDDIDLAYAIESFVHGPAPDRFFAEAARVIRPGGLLVICDDIRRETADAAADRTIDRFRRGWHVNTLLTRDELQAMARAAGFEHISTEDLTAAVEIYRPRDRVIDLLGTLFGWLPFARRRVDYLLGGSALQRGLARGWIGYELAVFRRLKVATTGL